MPLSLTTKFVPVSVSSTLIICIWLYDWCAVVIDCTGRDLFLEACSHMLVPVVCGFVRERQMDCMCDWIDSCNTCDSDLTG